MHKTQQLLIGLAAAMFLVTSIIPMTMSAKAFAQSQITIDGAGASFPFPLIDTWRVEYKKIKTDVNLNYQSVGSGAGIRQFTVMTVDFGGTDAPLTAAQRSALPGPAVHIPETIGSVVAAYNLPEFPNKGLKLTGPVIADIFLGKITSWDNAQIKELNPGVSLPSRNIVVVHRSDGSGTSFVWTDYLSKVSPEWKEKVGKGTAVQWPTGIGGTGNEGVANSVKSTQYAIGYIELAYALTTNTNFAFIKNKEGNFIEPSLVSTKAAVATSAPTLPKGDESWETVSLTDAGGAQSYPIASFSYLLLYKELSTNPRINSMDKAKALVDFVSWAIVDGQQFADDLSYVPLPEEVVKLDQETLESLTYNGQQVTGANEPPDTTEPPTTTEPPGQEPEPFTTSSTLDGNSYTITGKSEKVKAISFTINPKQSVRVEFDGAGEVELTLPKSMIDGISAVMSGNQEISYQKVSSSDSSTTIKFTMPDNADSVEIRGATVVPEFNVIAALVLAGSLVAVVGLAKFTRTGRGLRFSQL